MEVFTLKRIFTLIFIFVILHMGTAFASVEEHIDNEMSYEMSYPIVYTNNKAIQDKINQDIYHYIISFKDDYKAGKFYEGKFSYEVKFEDDNYVSLTITDYRYNLRAVYGHSTVYGIVYDKNTGQKLPLSHFLRVTLDDLKLIVEGHLYNWSGTKIKADMRWHKLERVSEDYYLLGDGGIALIYRRYELASGGDDTTTIRLSSKDIDYFNRKNR